MKQKTSDYVTSDYIYIYIYPTFNIKDEEKGQISKKKKTH